MLKCHICGQEFERKKQFVNHHKIHKEYIILLKDEIIKLKDKTVKEIYDIFKEQYQYPFDEDFIRKYKNQLTAEINCPCCNNKFLTEKYLYIHIIKNKNSDNEHNNLYEKQIQLIEKYKENIEKIKDDKEFLLHIDFAKKYLQKNGIGKYKCEVCGDAFDREVSLIFHYKQKNTDGYRDELHDKFLKLRKEEILKLHDEGKFDTEIYKITKFPMRLIRKITNSVGKLKCPYCDEIFKNRNSVKNHIHQKHFEYIENSAQSNIKLFLHDYIESIKPLIIGLYNSNLNVNKIIKKNNFFISKDYVAYIWIKNIPNLTLNDISNRSIKISSKTRKKLFKSGKIKIWCDGLTILTSDKLREAGFKISQSRIKKNKENGIVSDDELRESFDYLLFNRLKKQIRKESNETCKCCGKTSKEIRIDIHHIIPYRLSQCDFKSNLVPLCIKCHIKLHNIGWKIEKKDMILEEKFELWINEYNKFINKKPAIYSNPEFRAKKLKYQKDRYNFIKK